MNNLPYRKGANAFVILGDEFLVGQKEELKLQEEELKQIKWVTQDELEKHFIFEGQWESAEKVLNDLKNQGLL